MNEYDLVSTSNQMFPLLSNKLTRKLPTLFEHLEFGERTFKFRGTRLGDSELEGCWPTVSE
ncbi:hypothetical protein VKT23_013176 [Stygiomarasmius scandens]|uniref:Uncharacterized protein n=1 Tax=Marasmiellus scandens TaxID=2682957 RepID=A0ABR1J4E7_9AGAR